MGVPSYWQQVVKGAVLLLAVFWDELRRGDEAAGAASAGTVVPPRPVGHHDGRLGPRGHRRWPPQASRRPPACAGERRARRDEYRRGAGEDRVSPGTRCRWPPGGRRGRRARQVRSRTTRHWPPRRKARGPDHPERKAEQPRRAHPGRGHHAARRRRDAACDRASSDRRPSRRAPTHQPARTMRYDQPGPRCDRRPADPDAARPGPLRRPHAGRSSGPRRGSGAGGPRPPLAPSPRRSLALRSRPADPETDPCPRSRSARHAAVRAACVAVRRDAPLAGRCAQRLTHTPHGPCRDRGRRCGSYLHRSARCALWARGQLRRGLARAFAVSNAAIHRAATGSIAGGSTAPVVPLARRPPTSPRRPRPGRAPPTPQQQDETDGAPDQRAGDAREREELARIARATSSWTRPQPRAIRPRRMTRRSGAAVSARASADATPREPLRSRHGRHRSGSRRRAGRRGAYRIAGSGERTLLTLHGGPGAPSSYIWSLADLAGDDLRVVFWDQLGCGESDQPDDPSLWRVDRFVDEVEAVRQGLGLGRVDVLGQSWGGMLAQEYALAHPDAVRTLILASTIASSAFHRQELRGSSPTCRTGRASRSSAPWPRATTTSPGTSRPWPRRTAATSAASRTRRRGALVRRHGDGRLRGDVGPGRVPLHGQPGRLGRHRPHLGDHRPDAADRGPPRRADARVVRAHPAADRRLELVVFEDSAHLAHWEERERYMEVVRDFLRRHPG